jgi:lipoprotein-anchoring transpeptidase ErfK/SrfK
MMAALATVLVAAGRAMAQNGQQSQEQAPRRRIVVSIPDRKLALIVDDKVVKIYQTAVGADNSPSPRGIFKVVSLVPNPTWYHAGKVVPPGKNNPVGSRWIGLSEKGYGIHGTNAPKSIGSNVSHGCVRMRNRDVEQLFELVKVGDVVEMHGELNETVAQIFHPAEQPVLVADGKSSVTAGARRLQEHAPVAAGGDGAQ